MSKIALDVILLPNQKMNELAIEYNKRLLENNPPKVVLDSQSRLPHISLFMGAVEETDVPKVAGIIQKVSQQHKTLALKADSIKVSNSKPQEHFSMLNVMPNDQLQALFKGIAQQLKPYFTYDNIDSSLFINPQEIEDISIEWLRNFEKKTSNPSLFNPHISLGVGDANTLTLAQPFDFTTPKIALCQLGNYCACRRVINTFKLS